MVDNTVDPGDDMCGSPSCTLREAITAANNNPGVDTIIFNIPDAGVQTITPTSPLPTITETVTIDGYTQPGASANTLTVSSDLKSGLTTNPNDDVASQSSGHAEEA